MKDDITDCDRSVAILPNEELAGVRLILQRPEDDHVLLVRYKATEAECRPGYGELPAYWSFKGIPSIKLIGAEASVAEAIVRVAYQQLGILVEDLEHILIYYDRQVSPPEVRRVYYLVRQWSGELPRHISEPDSFTAQEGIHEWASTRAIGHYLHHPEVISSVRAWEDWQKKHGADA